MLSILIPTYNYNAFPLVAALHEQARKENITYEIIVSDDASTDSETIQKNEAINALEHCQYHINPYNLGRGENRNALTRKAQYDWVLLLDCDTIPVGETFLKKYIDCIKNSSASVFFGGLAYEKNAPENDEMLRWVYGAKREALPVSKRNKKPYTTALVSNILVKKSILLQHPFHALIYDYGFEDFVFIAELKKNNIEIVHIDNAVYHLNLEKSTVFLKKHLAALDNLYALVLKNIIQPEETALGQWQNKLLRFGLDRPTAWLFNRFEPSLKKNLISDKPSLLVFDFYKLGYFCGLKYA